MLNLNPNFGNLKHGFNNYNKSWGITSIILL